MVVAVDGTTVEAEGRGMGGGGSRVEQDVAVEREMVDRSANGGL